MSKHQHTKQKVNERSKFHEWWRLLKPYTLLISFVSILLGSMLALYMNETFQVFLFIALFIAVILIQGAMNIIYSYDHTKRGHEPSKSEKIKPESLLTFAFTFLSIAALLTIYICIESSWWIAVILLVGVLFGYFYKNGPFPIAHTPFAEFYTGFLLGTVMLGVSYYIQTVMMPVEVLFLSIPIAILIGCIILSQHIQHVYQDHQYGRTTIVILLGRTYAIYFLASLFLAAYAFTALFIVFDLLPTLSCIAFLSILKAISATSKFLTKTAPSDIEDAQLATRQTAISYGMLLGLSLLISTWI